MGTWISNNKGLSIVIGLVILYAIYKFVTRNSIAPPSYGSSSTSGNVTKNGTLVVYNKPTGSVTPNATGAAINNAIPSSSTANTSNISKSSQVLSTYSVNNPTNPNLTPVSNQSQSLTDCLNGAKNWSDVTACLKKYTSASDFNANSPKLNKIGVVINKLSDLSNQLISSINSAKTYNQIVDAYKVYYNNYLSIINQLNDPIFNPITTSINQSLLSLKGISGNSNMNKLIPTNIKNNIIEGLPTWKTWKDCFVNKLVNTGGTSVINGAYQRQWGTTLSGVAISAVVSIITCLGAKDPVKSGAFQILNS